MTLNTFHLAGVANLNVTKGIPRLKELLNCSSNIKTPFVKFKLSNPDCDVNKFKEILLDTFLKESELLYNGTTLKMIGWVQRFRCMFLRKRKLPYETRNWLHLKFDKECPLTMFQIRKTLLEVLPGILILCTHSSDPTNELYISLGKFDDVWSPDEYEFNMNALRNIHLDGILGVKKVVMEEDNVILPDILLETDFITSFVDDVDLTTLCSNDVSNTYEMFGIEAARTVLYREMKGVLNNDGAYVNPRHISIICDSITKGGFLRPMSRHGLFIDKRSALSNASFEMCTTTFNNAAVSRNVDLLKGVTEQIIVGKNHNFGTGMVDLLLDEQMFIDNDVQCNDTDFPSDNIDFIEPAYVPTSPEYSPLSSPPPDTVGEFAPYSPAASDAQFSPCPASPMYSPSTPCYSPSDSPMYSPSTPSYAPATPDITVDDEEKYVPSSPVQPPPKNDWLEEELLEEAFG